MSDLYQLQGTRITVAVTGGIAAYKACEVVRLFKKAGADVSVIMTKAAAEFVTPLTFQTLSGHPVGLDVMATPLSHLKASQACDLFLVVPATANILAKFANGIADDLVSSAGVARTAPTAVCPSMNVNMWLNPATQRNIRQLKEDGVHVWGPAAGDLACGVKGTGRLIEPGEIVERAVALLTPKVLVGKKAVVTAGPDWRSETVAATKMKKVPGADRLTLTFVKNPDVIASVKAAFPDITAVGFAAETENVEAAAKAKLAAKHLDAVIGNNGPATFGRDTNTVVIVTEKGVRTVETTTKERIAGEIVTEIVGLLKEKTHA